MCGETNYRATLATLWVETVLYGAYIILFFGYIFICDSLRPNRRWLIVAVMMFALSSALMFTDLTLYLLTPDTTGNTVCVGDDCDWCDGVPDNTFEDNVVNLSDVILDVVFTTNQLVADGLLIYRCFVVWSSRMWVIIAPTLLALVAAVAGYVQAHVDAQLYFFELGDTSQSDAAESKEDSLNSIYFKLSYTTASLSLATNVLVTITIASRIWWITRELEISLGTRAGRKYRAAISMIIESGAIYSTTLLIQLVLLKFSPSLYQPIVSNAVNQIVGIVPTMIMIRVGLGLGFEQTTVHESNVSTLLAPASRLTWLQPMAFAQGSVVMAPDTEMRNLSAHMSSKADVALSGRPAGSEGSRLRERAVNEQDDVDAAKS